METSDNIAVFQDWFMKSFLFTTKVGRILNFSPNLAGEENLAAMAYKTGERWWWWRWWGWVQLKQRLVPMRCPQATMILWHILNCTYIFQMYIKWPVQNCRVLSYLPQRVVGRVQHNGFSSLGELCCQLGWIQLPVSARVQLATFCSILAEEMEKKRESGESQATGLLPMGKGPRTSCFV